MEMSQGKGSCNRVLFDVMSAKVWRIGVDLAVMRRNQQLLVVSYDCCHMFANLILSPVFEYIRLFSMNANLKAGYLRCHISLSLVSQVIMCLNLVTGTHIYC
jgi:hypothetical protein